MYANLIFVQATILCVEAKTFLRKTNKDLFLLLLLLRGEEQLVSKKDQSFESRIAMGVSDTRFLQELVLYAASAALSCLVLFAGLRQLDPNRASSKKALEQKKEIAKRLGRPLIQTNSYEV